VIYEATSPAVASPTSLMIVGIMFFPIEQRSIHVLSTSNSLQGSLCDQTVHREERIRRLSQIEHFQSRCVSRFSLRRNILHDNFFVIVYNYNIKDVPFMAIVETFTQTVDKEATE